MISMNPMSMSKSPSEQGSAILPMAGAPESYQEPLNELLENPSESWPLLFFGGWPAFFFNGLSVMTRSYTEMIRAWGMAMPSPHEKEKEEIVGISENDREIVISTELPGFEDDEVQARIKDGRLAIKGEKHQTANDDQFHLSYRRVMPLPSNMPLDEAKASYHNGVLEMRIPKSKQGEEQEAADIGVIQTAQATIERVAEPEPRRPAAQRQRAHARSGRRPAKRGARKQTRRRAR